MAKAKKEDFPLDEFHYHEAIDRCDTANRIIEDMLVEHHVFQAKENRELLILLGKAQDLISEVYVLTSRQSDAIFHGMKAPRKKASKKLPPKKASRTSRSETGRGRSAVRGK